MVHYRLIKLLLLLFFVKSLSFAITINDIKRDFNSQKYKSACDKASKIYNEYSDNEIYLNLFAFSCIKAGIFNRVFLPIVNLTNSKEARENATFYLTLLYQKQLLVNHILDKKDISNIILPQIEHIISIIYQKFQKSEYHFKKDENLYFIQVNKQILEVGVVSSEGDNALFVNSYLNNELVESRVFR